MTTKSLFGFLIRMAIKQPYTFKECIEWTKETIEGKEYQKLIDLETAEASKYLAMLSGISFLGRL